MRKIDAHMYVTLDGRAEFPPYPGSDSQSKKPDPAFIEMWIDWYDPGDALLFGRRAFDDHSAFWPESRRTASDPKFLHEFSRWLWERARCPVESRDPPPSELTRLGFLYSQTPRRSP